MQVTTFPGSARFVETDQLDHIIRLHAAERAVRIAGRHNLVIGAEDEFGRLDNAAAVFPPRPQRIRNFAGNAFTDREVYLFGNFLGFVFGVAARCDDGNTKFIELCLIFCEADQLSATVGSPVTPVEQDNLVLGIKVSRQV